MGLLDALANMSTLALVIFVVGIVCLVIEMFSPGFGVSGGTGLLLLFIGIVMTAQNLTQGLIMTAILLVLAAFLAALLFRSATKGRLSRTLVLRGDMTEHPVTAAVTSLLQGQTGKTVTDLHPSGHADFDGKRVDVVTRGEYIGKGNRVRVVQTDGNRVVVAGVQE